MALDNRIAHDYLLADQGEVCAIANTTCCTWIIPLGKMRPRQKNKAHGY